MNKGEGLPEAHTGHSFLQVRCL